MSDEIKAWIFLGLAFMLLLGGLVQDRRDLGTDALILLAISTIYGARSKP